MIGGGALHGKGTAAVVLCQYEGAGVCQGGVGLQMLMRPLFVDDFLSLSESV